MNLKDMTNEESIEILNEAIKLFKPFNPTQFGHKTLSLKTQADVEKMREFCKVIPIREHDMFGKHYFYTAEGIWLMMSSSSNPWPENKVKQLVTTVQKTEYEQGYEDGYDEAMGEEGYGGHSEHKFEYFQIETIEVDENNNVNRFIPQKRKSQTTN